MKALTVQQPWAWAIFYGKLIENRTQLWSYRGPLAIHAGARWSDRGGQSELVEAAWRDATTNCTTEQYSHASRLWTARSEFLGVVDLADCHPDAGCHEPWGESSYVEHGGRVRRRITHLVLENPRSLAEPVYCKGALGLWNPPADVVAKIEAQL
ncbi:hypothetical protein [Mycolicibacterium mageritense]|uniref:hypothetical protein n=1 Tax=Mycolicibacterium mageritense TaxID=53462 RepID=UPI001E5B9C4E|nr:hypothetical protein [Mycolicibacterium mageritense]MCC9181146.1 hypothetical protein [Mycolicibacterium mageritense]